VETTRPTEFVDLTARLERIIAEIGFSIGVVNVQVRHTTAALVVNEQEPLLLADFEDFLAGLAPAAVRYRHDDRLLGLGRDPADHERRNGHSHCRALLLPSTASLNVMEGRLQLGPWQRVFFVELDGPRDREVSMMLLGEMRR
jgi:secondary thiamine-phosphate synthase enzyme